MIDVAKEATFAAGKILKENYGRLSASAIRQKAVNDFISFVDEQSEATIISTIKKAYPDHSFLAEESGLQEDNTSYQWIIDPLDGTTNFIHGVPLYSISIALMQNNEIVSGVVYEVNLKECFYAWQGSKAFLNSHEINVSKAETIKDGLFATGFPYHDYSRLDDYLEIFIHLMKNSHGVRRLGTAAVDLAYVACGRYEGFYEYGLHPWDVAAGELIVRQAGGAVSDLLATIIMFSEKRLLLQKKAYSGNSLN